MKKTLLSAILSLPLLVIAQSPITTSGTQYTPQQLVTDVLLEGTGISATNITSSTGTNFGSVNGLGYFTNGGGDFSFEDGIILSTGNIASAPGPNANIQNAGTGNWEGDSDVLAVMQQVATGTITSLNATKLEFDFTAVSNQINIDYIFAAEEYGLYQCMYSDAFVILLTDLSNSTSQNLAVIPGTTVPVCVLTVRDNAYNNNCASMNPAFFGEYNAQGNNPVPINFNGQTVQMSAHASLVPGHSYHLKIAIADRNDPAYDSALFIERINASGPGYITNAGEPNDLYACDVNLDGVATFNLTENDVAILDGQNPAEFTITYFETLGDAENNAANNIIQNPDAYTNIVASSTNNSQTIYARLSGNLYESYDVVSFQIIVAPQPYAGEPEPIILIDNDNDSLMAVDLTTQEVVIFNGLDPDLFEITYHISEMTAEIGLPDISVPEAYNTQSAIVYFRLENIASGCYDTGEIEVIVLPSDYETAAPDGNEQQQFESGDTLADLDVDGEDIQWYDTPGQAGPPTTTDTDVPLPLSTVLVDGTTYYASQTIYGIESVQRLAVTVHVTMRAGESIFENFTAFPNPVKDVLHISNNSSISNVAIYNLVGQLVQGSEVNAGTATINLHNLAKGIYIVKVQSGNAEKAIRIVKE